MCDHLACQDGQDVRLVTRNFSIEIRSVAFQATVNPKSLTKSASPDFRGTLVLKPAFVNGLSLLVCVREPAVNGPSKKEKELMAKCRVRMSQHPSEQSL